MHAVPAVTRQTSLAPKVELLVFPVDLEVKHLRDQVLHGWHAHEYT